MTDSSKNLKVGGNKLERLTNLPINVIHQIQDHITIEDAARMSVLSRAWRYVWASNPNLVFDEKFSSIIISTIVSQHHGAIKKFHATIRSFDHSTVDDWMLLLSRNGIVELTIDNTSDVNAPYRLPLCVYGMKLEGLYLSNCIFRPPCSSFQNFHRLKGLSLNLVSFDKLHFAISSSLWMPNLERLIFCNCNGLHLVNVYAPKLLLLMVLFCDTDFLTIGTFMDCEKLENVKITFREKVSQNRRDKAIKLTHLLSSWPNLSKLLLDRYVLELFQRKNIMETDANLLEGSVWNRTHGLDNLKKLKIKGFHGSTNEFVFVKSILISAPLLQKVSLLVHNSSLHQIRLLRKELMRFPRASTKLKLKCEPLRGK